MRLARSITCWLLPLLFVGVLAAQESPSVLRITAAAAEQNVLKKVEPVYPEMARIAHVEGRVIVGIIISPEGKVSSERAISGHPILIQSVMVAVNQWEYRPYLLEGKLRAVTALVRVPFSLGHTPKEDPGFTAYDEQETKCQVLLDRQSYASAQQVCAPLPELAEKATFRSDIAYGLSGRAYFRAANFHDALVAWQHQLAITKDWHPSSESGEAYFNVARALQATGDLNGARSHYEHAVNNFESLHHDIPESNAIVEHLRIVLQNYASLLRQMGNKEKAEAMEKKAEAIAAKSKF
ncbi:MAG TPA: TonB family protein [Candidatus Angelobacter sp.]|nr:TonB family protein [Candidatus Angelobacter sp.]